MRMHFNDLFIIQNNMMTVKQGLPIRIGSMIMEYNAWYPATGGVIVGGVDLSQLVGKELEVEIEYAIRVVKRVYPFSPPSPSRGGRRHTKNERLIHRTISSSP